MEFKCMWATEPVSECPPVKELERLRADVKRLEQENRWMEEENRKLREENRELEESRKRIAARADDLEDSLFCK